jgi:hypothetical protein
MTPLLERHFHVTLIELVAFQVSVVVACREAHLVRLSAFDEGGGADAPDVFVGEGDDALGGAAGEMGRGAFVVVVVSGPTEPTGSVIRTLAAVVTRILAVASKAVGEGWQLTLAEYRPWRSAGLFHSATFQAVFSFAVFGMGVSGSLSGVEARDDARWG